MRSTAPFSPLAVLTAYLSLWAGLWVANRTMEDLRGEVLGTLSQLIHEKWIDPRFGELLDQIELPAGFWQRFIPRPNVRRPAYVRIREALETLLTPRTTPSRRG